MRILSLPVNFVKVSIGSKRSRLLAVAVVSVMAILLAASVFVAKRSSAHGVNSARTKQQGCCGNEPAIPRRMIGTYYMTEDGFQSTLILNNKGPNQIAVTPILHSQAGQTFTASPVAVGGQSSYDVDLNLLASLAGPQFRSGSFEFTYEGRILEVGGGLRIVNAEKSLIFDEQMLEPGMKFSSSRLEAVYAIPFVDSQVSVIITNTTAQPIIVNGDAIFAGANGHHPVQSQLGPYQTQVINLPQGLVKKASAGAVSLNHNGSKGALLTMIHLWDADRGYSEAVNFTDPGDKTTERHGAGLRLGSINNDPLRPVIAVRNIGKSATTVTATIPYSKQNGETGTISLPQVSLAPGEIKLLNTSNPQLRRNDFATAGLEIKYTGAPGSVIATASSVSRSGNQVFTLPMKDPKSGLSSTGGYPWFIDEKGSTVVFIKNTTERQQQFHLDIIFPGGQWGSNLRTLAPGQTFKLDVREIRDSQAKGSEGNTIPLEATRGHIYWSVFGTAEKVLIGRAQTVDLAGGMASTYECQVCTCPASFAGARLTPSSIVGFPGDTALFLPQEQDQNCFGPLSCWFNVPGGATFSSANPSVATIDSGGSATCAAPGSTTLLASWTGTVYFSSGGDGCEVQYAEANPGAFCDVQAPDFTVAHDKQQTGIRPTGIIAGTNGADPPIPTADTQATVTVSTNPPTSGQNVTLSVVADEGGQFTVGGHIDHIGVRPVGTLGQTSGTTGQDGTFTTIYTAPIFGGLHTIRAIMNGVTKEVGIGVFIDGLQELPAGSDYDLIGAPTGSRHPFNHWGTATAVAKLPLIASDYLAMFPGSDKMAFNDMSLVLGGKFEIAGDWGNGAHQEHRVGRNCDVRYTNIPAARHPAVELIFRTRNVTSWLKHPISATDTAPPHYHVRF